MVLVLISGIVAVVLNLILPQEDVVAEDDEDIPAEVVQVDVEAHPHGSEKK